MLLVLASLVAVHAASFGHDPFSYPPTYLPTDLPTYLPLHLSIDLGLHVAVRHLPRAWQFATAAG